MSEAGYGSLEFTGTFLDTYASRDFSPSERGLFKKALRLLDENEQHPSLRVHELRGPLKDVWSASASGVLRVTFERTGVGRNGC